MVETIGCWWEAVQDVLRVLKRVRLSLLVTVLAGGALALTGQGQDLARVQASAPLSYWSFYPAMLFWALNAWYWARVTLANGRAVPVREACPPGRRVFGGRPARVAWLVTHVPRIIGVGALACVVWAQLEVLGEARTRGSVETNLMINIAVEVLLAVAVYIFLIKRRALLRRLGAGCGERTRARLHAWEMLPPGEAAGDWGRRAELCGYDPKTGRSARPWQLPMPARAIAWVLSLLALGLVVLGSVLPALTGVWLGPEFIFMVGASLWIAPASCLLFRLRRGGVPFVTTLVVLALVFSFWNNNHDVRALDGGGAPDARPDALTAYQAWNAAEPAPQGPFTMVATAGGGSRAAYWTTTVLGAIRDRHPGFDRQLFAISGVSGGSVGAAAYGGLVAEAAGEGGALTCRDPWDDDAPRRQGFAACGQAVTGQDFLGPALMGLLGPDLLQRILPAALLPDRAAALEKGFEAGWAGAFPDGPNRMAADFLDLWAAAGEGWRPALLLNGTSVATGRRIVTSNLDVATVVDDGFDFLENWQHPGRIRLSTAADNSARFPGIGPAGTITRQPSANDPNTLDRIVDGGYFENFGAATALDVLTHLAETGAGPLGMARRGGAGDDRPRFLVVQISSDPAYEGVDREHAEARVVERASPGSFAYEVTSPITTLLNTRTARGTLAAQRLYDWTVSNGGLFVEFRMIVPRDETPPPLGWTLSEPMRGRIRAMLDAPANACAMAALRRAMGAAAALPSGAAGQVCRNFYPTLFAGPESG